MQFAGAPTLHYAGVSVVGSNPAGYPRWRGSFTVDYDSDRFGVTVNEQMAGSMRLDIPGTVPGVNLPTNIAVYDIMGRAYTAGIRFKF